MLNNRHRIGGHRLTHSIAGTHTSAILSGRNTFELFAKANFLISSTAIDTEMSDFLGSIRDALTAQNTFYELEPETVVISPPPIPQSPTSPRVRSRSRPRTPTERRDRYDRTNYSTYSRPGTASFSRPGTATFSRPGTGVSQNTLRSDAWHSRREFSSRDAWEGFVDSDDDEYDRIVMPIVPRRINRKGNSRKALKWLGLA